MPFWHPAHLTIPAHMWPYYTEDQVPVRGWPKGVHPSTLLEDYLVWYVEEYAKAFDTPYYREFPERVPEPEGVSAFNWAMFRYLGKAQPFSKHIPTMRKNVDKWINVLKIRNYRVLPTLAECRDRYNALHPDDRVEAPAPVGPYSRARRLAPEDPGSAL